MNIQNEKVAVKNSSRPSNKKKKNVVKEIYTVDFLGMRLRVFGTPDNPMFIASDVAEWIGHSDVSTMCRTLEEGCYTRKVCIASSVISHGIDTGIKQNKEVLAITEQGLYRILWRSNKPNAQKFASKCADIIKEIRLTGTYDGKKDGNWLAIRQKSKHNRRELTDSIKEFVEKAKEQGSTHADWYYSNISKLVNKALDTKEKNRDESSSGQLIKTMFVEETMREELNDSLDEDIDYKDIYQHLKAVSEGLNTVLITIPKLRKKKK